MDEMNNDVEVRLCGSMMPLNPLKCETFTRSCKGGQEVFADHLFNDSICETVSLTHIPIPEQKCGGGKQSIREFCREIKSRVLRIQPDIIGECNCLPPQQEGGKKSIIDEENVENIKKILICDDPVDTCLWRPRYFGHISFVKLHKHDECDKKHGYDHHCASLEEEEEEAGEVRLKLKTNFADAFQALKEVCEEKGITTLKCLIESHYWCKYKKMCVRNNQRLVCLLLESYNISIETKYDECSYMSDSLCEKPMIPLYSHCQIMTSIYTTKKGLDIHRICHGVIHVSSIPKIIEKSNEDSLPVKRLLICGGPYGGAITTKLSKANERILSERCHGLVGSPNSPYIPCVVPVPYELKKKPYPTNTSLTMVGDRGHRCHIKSKCSDVVCRSGVMRKKVLRSITEDSPDLFDTKNDSNYKFYKNLINADGGDVGDGITLR